MFLSLECFALHGFATSAFSGKATVPFFEINDTTQEQYTTIESPKAITSAPLLDDTPDQAKDSSYPSNLVFASRRHQSTFENSAFRDDIITFASLIRPYHISLEITEIDETIDERRIISQYISNKSGRRRIELDHSYLNSTRLVDTLYHEFGHFLWYDVLSEEEKTNWQNMTQRHPVAVNAYAESSAEEGWAETFTTFYSEKPSFATARYCPKTITKQTNSDIKERHTVMQTLLEPYYISLIPYSSYVAQCNE